MLEGHDIFAALPTGYGKSYCFAMLLHIYDYLREKKEPTFIIIIVSPLQSLMSDQKRRFGISSQVVKSEEFNDPDNHLKKEITEGKFQLLYISPKFLLQSLAWNEMLRSTVYTENLVAFVIDEVHTVSKWWVQYIGVRR